MDTEWKEMHDVFLSWNLSCTVSQLLEMWNETHRCYHTQEHLKDIIEQIHNDQQGNPPKLEQKFSQKEYEKLLLTAIFHDCIYDPLKSDNEERSAEFFMKSVPDQQNTDALDVRQMILDTKSHQAFSELSRCFQAYDMNIVERDFEALLEWEHGIFGEYQSVGNKLYQFGRLKFLRSICTKYPKNETNIRRLIHWVEEHYKDPI